jgi:putative ABC transport system substrate-binding protein
MIRRREFIAGLGGAAAWPVAAPAQQPARMRRIGVLMVGAADDRGSPVIIGALLQGMAELGWTDRRNVVIDYRWAAGEAERYRKFATESRTLAGCHRGCRRPVGGCFATGDPFDTNRVRGCQ